MTESKYSLPALLFRKDLYNGRKWKWGGRVGRNAILYVLEKQTRKDKGNLLDELHLWGNNQVEWSLLLQEEIIHPH